MKLVKSSKNHNSRYFLNAKLKEMDKISPINFSSTKINNNKFINSSKKSVNVSFPIIIKEDKEENIKKDKINLIYNSQKFLSTKDMKKQIKHIDFNNIKSNKKIIRKNTLNKNYNIKAFKYFNFFSGKENDKSKDINDKLDNLNFKNFFFF